MKIETLPDVDRLERVLGELAKTLDGNKNPFADPRKQRQLGIEQALIEFRPDAIEAAEILCAVRAALADRYGKEEIADVEHEANQLNEALEELWRTSP